jgi:ATP-binding cassette subfamily F protein uup
MVEKLSGGEKKRLHLMRVLMQNPNFLILDEPTNDLDIDTLNVLEEFLEGFQGVLILVSHDRYLLDKMSEQLFILEGNGSVKIYNGNYSDYRNSLEVAVSKPEPEKKQAEKTPGETPKRKRSFKEQKELEELEGKMEAAELRISELTSTLHEIDSSDFGKLKEVADEIEAKKRELDDMTYRWLELSEI